MIRPLMTSSTNWGYLKTAIQDHRLHVVADGSVTVIAMGGLVLIANALLYLDQRSVV